MPKKTVKEVDLSKLKIAIKLSPVAKYPDNNTWGAKIESIIINDLPKPKAFDFALTKLRPPDCRPIFLLLENGKATLEQ